MSEVRDEYNRSGMIAFMFSLVFVCCFFVYLVTFHKGVDLGENVKDPSTVSATSQVVAVDITKIPEPWKSNDDVVKHGAKVFSQNCAMCHGNEGKGDGAAGAALNPKPRNFVEGKWTKGGDSISLFNTLTNGIPGSSMAGYKHFSSADRWALVQFVRSITQNKVGDDDAKLDAFAKANK